MFKTLDLQIKNQVYWSMETIISVTTIDLLLFALCDQIILCVLVYVIYV